MATFGLKRRTGYGKQYFQVRFLFALACCSCPLVNWAFVELSQIPKARFNRLKHKAVYERLLAAGIVENTDDIGDG